MLRAPPGTESVAIATDSPLDVLFSSYKTPLRRGFLFVIGRVAISLAQSKLPVAEYQCPNVQHPSISYGYDSKWLTDTRRQE
jgi:hypothetical protein